MTRRIGAAALAREALAFARHGLSMLNPGDEGYLEGNGTEPLTVFIHGYLATSAMFGPMRARLARDGIAGRQLHFTYAPTGTMDTLARSVDARIRAVAPTGPVNIVGHSFGGLVGRYVCQILERPVARLVCIATPHAGTDRARWYRALPLARELAPGSATLRLLHDTRERLAGVILSSLLAEDDLMLVPVESAALAGHRVIRVQNAGHQSVLLNDTAIAHVAALLAEPGETGRGPDSKSIASAKDRGRL